VDAQRLVAMANDIAAFFDSEPEKAVAAEGVDDCCELHPKLASEPTTASTIIALRAMPTSGGKSAG
jgi:hypothetical protein